MRLPGLAAQSEGHVSRTAAEIEDTGIRAAEDVAEGARGAAPPHAIHIERQHMVQKIVAWRNGGKHFAHSARRRALVARPFRSGANDCRFVFRHGNSEWR